MLTLCPSRRPGLLHSRLLLKAGPLGHLFSPPMYARLEIGLTLTPSAADAEGAAARTAVASRASVVSVRRSSLRVPFMRGDDT